MTRPITRALEAIVDAQGVNHAEARVLCNLDTPEVDSLIEAIVRLPMPTETRRALAALAQQALHLNTQEGDFERTAAGEIDQQATREQMPGVKILRELLCPLLDDPAHDDRVREMAADPRIGREVLRSKSMRNELGPGKHARLCGLIGAS